ncbi:MAG: isoamylase early set domain-containing protein [Proteobacteria bacterium]|nr:isoamylase early set domain-containing protein [Pseudomonadota bacterium]MBU4036492.1 isoamylase early set domain-containing protein [Pseudomonadota bacterium]
MFIIMIATSGCSGLALLAMNYNAQPMLFQYEGQAQSVCLTGDFNKWSPNTHCMDKQDGLWYIRVMLPAGTHRYAYIVNGRQWVVDPKALFIENDGFDRQNSIIIIN